MKTFFQFCFYVFSRRVKLFAFLNAVYFCSLFVTAFVASLFFVPPPYEGQLPEFLVPYLGENLSWLFFKVFLFNLVLSAFVFVTLPGLVFFPLSAVALLVRAVLWGLLLYQLPTSVFLIVLPTFVFEGEAWVLAALAGTCLGASWFKPAWMYGGEGLSRRDALKRMLKECECVYFLVILFLLVGAFVEVLTIAFSV
ncbi:MAG: stage II sporulation protein M [Candidatus Bathyarchaeota archaeon]|jgi:hypothetical protein|nr:stage II sporulation protein M [Candidatus Bathyarchaeota archaeon]